MQLSLFGINHHTAPVAIREKVAINGGSLEDTLSLLKKYVPHAVIISTCNRTEIYTTGTEGDHLEQTIMEFLRNGTDLSYIQLAKYIYASRHLEAARHLFRVASGLESMIIGEYEVLGQVKQSLEVAEKAGMVNLLLRQAFQSAIRTGRMVREQTGISRNALSVSSVAVDLAAGITGDLQKCKMVVIGAGEAGRLVAKVASERGASQIVIASRTKDSAQMLAKDMHGIPVDLSKLDVELYNANIVVTCAGAPHRILSLRKVAAAMSLRPSLPLVIIDIAVPRNVEPDVAKINNVFLYNMDGLSEIAETNRKQREGEINHAEKILTEEVVKFGDWCHDNEIRPLVGALMTRAEEIRAAQLNMTLKRLPPLSAEQRENLESMTRSIVTRILKDPIQFLKTNGNSIQAELVMELFNLGENKRQ